MSSKRTPKISLSFRGVALTLTPDEARDIMAQLKAQQDKFVAKDFFVTKDYVRTELKRQFPDITPMELTKRVGHLWGRIVSANSPFKRYSSRGEQIAKNGWRDPETLRVSAHDLLEHHVMFSTVYQRGVGPITKGYFDVVIAAIERDLKG